MWLGVNKHEFSVDPTVPGSARYAVETETEKGAFAFITDLFEDTDLKSKKAAAVAAAAESAAKKKKAAYMAVQEKISKEKVTKARVLEEKNLHERKQKKKFLAEKRAEEKAKEGRDSRFLTMLTPLVVYLLSMTNVSLVMISIPLFFLTVILIIYFLIQAFPTGFFTQARNDWENSVSELLKSRKPIKIVASDMDGTLLAKGEKKISEKNLAQMRAMRAEGVKVVVATGRFRSLAEASLPAGKITGSSQTAEDYPIDYAILCNGSCVYSTKDGHWVLMERLSKMFKETGKVKSFVEKARREVATTSHGDPNWADPTNPSISFAFLLENGPTTDSQTVSAQLTKYGVKEVNKIAPEEVLTWLSDVSFPSPAWEPIHKVYFTGM